MSAMSRPLEGVRVLDLTRILAGPFATQQLVDLGAEVIKVEPVAGDGTRRFGPTIAPGLTTYFGSVNRGKKSVAIDLEHPRGNVLVVGLAQIADVVIESFRPGQAEQLGVGPVKLRDLHPRLVTCSITGWGSGGVPKYDAAPPDDEMIQSATGLMHITGDPDGHATKSGVAITALAAGLYAAQGIIAALFERERSGRGRHIDVSMQEAGASLLTYQAAIALKTHHSPGRTGNAHPSVCPHETVATKDGLFTLAVGTDAQFGRLCDALSLPWVKTDKRFSTNAARLDNRHALLALMEPKLLSKTRSEWAAIFDDAEVPGGPVLDVAEALQHPQLEALHTVVTHHHPIAGRIRTVGSPVRLDGPRPGPAEAPPLLSEHTREVLHGWLGLANEEIDELASLGVIADPRRDEAVAD